jgi:hypothetical protein
MSSCLFDELVGRVAALLKERASQEAIDQVLEPLSPPYRTEVLAAARELLEQDPARLP